MDNKELELRVKEILKNDNYFDMMIAAKNFASEYKASDYYAATKQPLFEMIKEAKMYYTFNIDSFFENIQEKISSLDVDKLLEVIDQLSSVFEQDNEEMKEIFSSFKDSFGSSGNNHLN